MKRTRKKHLDYFPLDVNLLNDVKIRKLICRQGGKSVTVYVALLCLIYGSDRGYYIGFDNDLLLVIWHQTGCELAYIREVLRSCLSVGLLDQSLFDKHGVLTSHGIQARYAEICKRLRQESDILEHSLLGDDPGTHVPKDEKTPENGQKSDFYENRAEKKIEKESIDKLCKEEEERPTGVFELFPGTERERLDGFMAWWNKGLEKFQSPMPRMRYAEDHSEGINRLLQGFTRQEIFAFARNAVTHPFANGRSRRSQGQVCDFDWLTASDQRIRKIIEKKTYL